MWQADPLVVLETARSMAERLMDETRAICRIPAPAFGEADRARYLHRRLHELGLQSVELDEIHNVTAVLPGSGRGPSLLLAAHIDTVFPAGTPVEPRFADGFWHAPGIRDNSASVAITLLLSELLRSAGVTLQGDLLLAFTVGEEGLGNLRGMRAVMERFAARVDGVIAVDGNLGCITNQGVSVRRLEVVGRTRGGHSWGDAGEPSAIHLLARMAAGISQLPVPARPKTTFNVGVFQGGTSVNAIAQEARFELDMRSTDPGALDTLDQQVRQVIAAEEGRVACQVTTRVVGERPGGRVDPDHAIVRAALAACRASGIPCRVGDGSTDANIPLSMGIPAIALGVSAGGGMHTRNEYLDPASLAPGAQALVLTVLSLQRGLGAPGAA